MQYHISINIRSALGWSNLLLDGLFANEDGSAMSADESRKYLLEQLGHGREVIPASECSNFDHEGTGCLGHEEPQQ